MNDCTQNRIEIASGAPILGIDVGEDYLDLALLSADRATLSYHRVPMTGITSPVVDAMTQGIAGAVGLDTRGAIALVDSPRTPRDVDCSGGKMIRRMEVPRVRVIDTALRELLRTRFNGTMRPLSMFPTPLVEYFAGCIASPICKPHLRAIGEELLAAAIRFPAVSSNGAIAGGTFTRFMLAGFAVFPALERLGLRTFEAYPDLQMRLWSDGVQIPPKGRRGEALGVRRNICANLAAVLGITTFQAPKTLDEADAAVLVLSAAVSAATGSLVELYCPAEGRFAVAFRTGIGAVA
jgi:hypothetical protein